MDKGNVVLQLIVVLQCDELLRSEVLRLLKDVKCLFHFPYIVLFFHYSPIYVTYENNNRLRF